MKVQLGLCELIRECRGMSYRWALESTGSLLSLLAIISILPSNTSWSRGARES